MFREAQLSLGVTECNTPRAGCVGACGDRIEIGWEFRADFAVIEAVASSAPAFAAGAENARRNSSVVMNDHDVMMVVMMVVVNDHHMIGKSRRRHECNGGGQ